MKPVGDADVDEVDILALDQAFPVGLDGLVAPHVGERGNPIGTSRGDGAQDRPVLQLREEVSYLAPGVGVRLAHEAIADHADVQGSVHLSPAF